MTGTVKAFVDRLLHQMPKGGLKPEALDRLETDEKDITRFFSESLTLAKVTEGIEPLAQLRAILTCESGEEFVDCFQFMLGSQTTPCLLRPEDVGLLCSKRGDIGRADAANVQRECDKVYQDWVTGKIVRQEDMPDEEEELEVGAFMKRIIKSPFRRMMGLADD